MKTAHSITTVHLSDGKKTCLLYSHETPSTTINNQSFSISLSMG